MNKVLFFIASILALCNTLHAQEERTEMLPFGDFENWTVRYIKESILIGGRTKALYMIGPTDTVVSNKSFTPKGNSPWGSSNAHAYALGVHKVACAVTPEKRGNGYCCRMESILENVNAIGINLKALATGSIFLGRLIDPVGMQHSSDPTSAIDMGMPFTKRPKALMLDFKAFIQPGGGIITANASKRVKEVEGHDEGQIVVILQHRWEENGHIYAYRVGTATEHISQSTNGWQIDHRLPIRYGDISHSSDFKPWEDLWEERFRTHNSKDKMVYIEEIGWNGDLAPTHIIIQISAGCQKPFTARPGNVVWCDNIRLVY